MEKGWFYTNLHGNVTYHYYPNQPGDPRISGNVSVTTTDFECFGQIKGDPDVAGLGVLIGVNLASCVAIIASILAFWFPYAREHWERTVARRRPAAKTQTPVSPVCKYHRDGRLEGGAKLHRVLQEKNRTDYRRIVNVLTTPDWPASGQSRGKVGIWPDLPGCDAPATFYCVSGLCS
ncbi:hypothetical protein IQ07DRAFT_582444, partial [Pyrenochaeta sp. DS3sAY3a]